MNQIIDANDLVQQLSFGKRFFILAASVPVKIEREVIYNKKLYELIQLINNMQLYWK